MHSSCPSLSSHLPTPVDAEGALRRRRALATQVKRTLRPPRSATMLSNHDNRPRSASCAATLETGRLPASTVPPAKAQLSASQASSDEHPDGSVRRALQVLTHASSSIRVHRNKAMPNNSNTVSPPDSAPSPSPQQISQSKSSHESGAHLHRPLRARRATVCVSRTLFTPRMARITFTPPSTDDLNKCPSLDATATVGMSTVHPVASHTDPASSHHNIHPPLLGLSTSNLRGSPAGPGPTRTSVPEGQYHPSPGPPHVSQGEEQYRPESPLTPGSEPGVSPCISSCVGPQPPSRDNNPRPIKRVPPNVPLPPPPSLATVSTHASDHTSINEDEDGHSELAPEDAASRTPRSPGPLPLPSQSHHHPPTSQATTAPPSLPLPPAPPHNPTGRPRRLSETTRSLLDLIASPTLQPYMNKAHLSDSKGPVEARAISDERTKSALLALSTSVATLRDTMSPSTLTRPLSHPPYRAAPLYSEKVGSSSLKACLAHPTVVPSSPIIQEPSSLVSTISPGKTRTRGHTLPSLPQRTGRVHPTAPAVGKTRLPYGLHPSFPPCVQQECKSTHTAHIHTRPILRTGRPRARTVGSKPSLPTLAEVGPSNDGPDGRLRLPPAIEPSELRSRSPISTVTQFGTGSSDLGDARSDVLFLSDQTPWNPSCLVQTRD